MNDAAMNEINTESEPYRIPRDTRRRFAVIDESSLSSTEVPELDGVLTVTPHIFDCRTDTGVWRILGLEADPYNHIKFTAIRWLRAGERLTTTIFFFFFFFFSPKGNGLYGEGTTRITSLLLLITAVIKVEAFSS